jgi:putative integral membrane protein (TIGR02587 family)
VRASETRSTALAYARGLLGGLLIGVPVLMTMEVWWEAFFIPAERLILLYVVNYGVLLILQHFSGLHHRKTMWSQARAALVAYGIGIVASGILLVALGVIRGELQLRDVAGKLLLESLPVSIGASVAMSEFGEESRVASARREHTGYWGSLGMALCGATLFSFGVSATEEPLMVAMQLSWKQAMLLLLLSLVQVHVIVYAVDFKSREKPKEPLSKRWPMLLRDAVSIYALAILVCAYFLWTFGTLDQHTGLRSASYMIVALAFVASYGAAAGELLI